MAWMVRVDTGERVPLLPVTRVGRAHDCDVRLRAAPDASRHHAVVRWLGDGWEVRDLGGRAGTRVNDVQLPPGGGHRVREGDHLWFGREVEWRLSSARPPRPVAIAADGRVTPAWAGAIVLPDVREPVVVVRWVRGRGIGEGGWVAGWERAGARRMACDAPGAVEVIHDGSRLRVDDTEWTFRLPPGPPPATPIAPDLADVGLRLWQGDDTRRIHAALRLAGGEVPLGERTHHQVLLTLARARFDARAAGDRDGGWVSPAAVVGPLGITEGAWYVFLWRIRLQLLSTGLVDPERLVQRRSTGELRIGTRHLDVPPSRA